MVNKCNIPILPFVLVMVVRVSLKRRVKYILQDKAVAEIQIIDRVKELLGNSDTEYKNVGKVPNQFYELFNKENTE